MGSVFIDNFKLPSEKGKSLFEFADDLKVRVPTSCGRTGECHECIVQVKSGNEFLNKKGANEVFLREGFRLACRAIIQNQDKDVKFDLLRRQPKILDKGIRRQFQVDANTFLEEGKVISHTNSPNEIIASDYSEIYGLGVDLGTTTVVCSLVDLSSGRTLGSSSFENPQRFGGSDTLHRISYDTGEFNGELQSVIISGLNFEIGELSKKFKVRRRSIFEMVVVGNTTMRDIFFGLDLDSIGQTPYKSITQLEMEEGTRKTTSLVEKAKNLGIRINPKANIYSPPLIGCHIGSDVTADLVSIGIDKISENFIVMDVGTNTEIVVGNSNKLFAASCPAGPAFEGGEVTYAMPGYDGAIEKFEILNGKQKFSTINNIDPQGICGSGLIDLLAVLKRNSIINEFGILSDGGEDFIIENTNGIKLSRKDMSSLAQAKAANYCGQSIVLKNAGINIGDYSKFYLSGGFANYINVNNAIEIGFIVGAPNTEIIKVGNSALEGSVVLLLNRDIRKNFENIVRSIKHVELEKDSEFFEHFVEGCQFKKLSVM